MSLYWASDEIVVTGIFGNEKVRVELDCQALDES